MIFKRYFFIFAFLLALEGCSFNDLTGSPGPAVAGGAAGAGSAALLGGSKYTIALAGIGGAALGYYVSTLTFAAGGVTQAGGQVYTLGDYVTIEIPTDRIFEDNSAELLPEADPVLQSTVEVLKRYPNNNILVSGNTSGYGTQRWELTLSERRARQVAAYLWAHGVSSFRGTSDYDPSAPLRTLSYVGYGNFFPISNNIKAASIRENSRIQITAYPSQGQLKLCKDQKIFANIGGLQEPLDPPGPVSSNGYKDETLANNSSTTVPPIDDNLYNIKDG